MAKGIAFQEENQKKILAGVNQIGVWCVLHLDLEAAMCFCKGRELLLWKSTAEMKL